MKTMKTMQNSLVQLMTWILNHLRPPYDVLMETNGRKQQNLKWTTIHPMAHGILLIYHLEQNASILDGFSVSNAMQMVLLNVTKLVSSQRSIEPSALRLTRKTHPDGSI